MPDAEVGRVVFQREAERSVAVLAIGAKLLWAARLGNHGLFGHGLDPVVVVLRRAKGSVGSGKLAARGEVVHDRSSW
jgi:hypothetical protein